MGSPGPGASPSLDANRLVCVKPSIKFETTVPAPQNWAVPDQDAPLSQAELDVAETVGQLMQFWGFKRPMGRIWTLLYLSPSPLVASEIGSRLRMSAGSVSMTLNELLKWGAVRRSWRPGERRDYFECETSVWKLVRRVLRERELRLVKEVNDTLERALEGLRDPAATVDHEQVVFKRERIETLCRLAKVGATLLAALDAGEAVSPEAIRSVSGGED